MGGLLPHCGGGLTGLYSRCRRSCHGFWRFGPERGGYPPRELLAQIVYRVAPAAAVAYVYFENEPGRRAAANLMSKDEARKIAAGIAKLPELTSAT